MARLPRHRSGCSHREPAAGHRHRVARCAAHRQAHALGRGRNAVRASGALGADVVGQRRHRSRSPRPEGGQPHLWPPLHGAEGAEALEPGVVRRHSAQARQGHGGRECAPGQHSCRRHGRGREAGWHRRHRRRAARRGHGPGRMARPAGGSFRSAVPRTATRSADRHDAGAPAVFPRARCAGEAHALVHHGCQHRKPRPVTGDRRQRTGRAPAPDRCSVLL